jgi:hypothetical protein
MDDKLLIHLNKNFANIETNKNNEVIYNLKEPIRLNPGDSVQLYKAFLDVRGQNENTITLDRDYTEEILFGYYIPQTPGLTASPYTDAQTTNIPFNRLKPYQQCPTHASTEYDQAALGGLVTDPLDFNYNPPTNVPCPMITLIDTEKPDGSGSTNISADAGAYTDYDNQPTYTASSLYAVDVKTIKVPAGNYQVEQLASIITAQMNGQTTADVTGENLFFNQDKEFAEDPTNITGSNVIAEVSSINTNMDNLLAGPFRFTKQLNSLATVQDYVAHPTYDTGVHFLDLSTCARQIPEYNTFAEDDTRPTGETYQTIGGLLYPVYSNEGVNGGRRVNPNQTQSGTQGKLFDTTMIPMSIVEAQYAGNVPGQGFQPLKWNDINNWPSTMNKVTWGCQQGTLSNCYQVQDGNTTNFDHLFSTDETVVLSGIQENARTIGTKSFLCSYGDASSDRFTISNLHEPFRVPTYGQSNYDNKVVANGADNVGNQATNFQLKDPVNLESLITPGSVRDISGCYYPQECTSGIYILSWSNQLKKQTQKYIDALAKRDALTENKQSDEYIALTNYLNINPHDYYYSDNEDPEGDWETTLWSRMGFTYEDFGKVSNTLEKFFTFRNIFNLRYEVGEIDTRRNKYSMLGTISHNDASVSMSTALSGLGQSIVPPNQSAAYQSFDTIGTLAYKSEQGQQVTFPTSLVGQNGKNMNKDAYMPYDNINLLATSKPISATQLPDLTGGSNYFVIQSDIVPANYLDVYGNKNNVVGFVSKENSTADTIFSVEAIPFTVSQERMLNSISVRVLNPDGTEPDDEILKTNSAFIFMIDRNKPEIVAE